MLTSIAMGAWDEIFGLLRSEHQAERDSAIESIRNLPEADAIAFVERAILDNSFWVRAAALELIGGAKWEAFSDSAIAMLTDEHAWVRSRAIEALGQIGVKSAAPEVIKAISDGDITVRLSAVWALGQIGDKSALDALIDVVAGKHSSDGDVPFPQLARLKEVYRSQLVDEAKNSIRRINQSCH